MFLKIMPMSLAELEQFILINHHLPEMPSATQIKDEGINTTETMALLLKKIEELTIIVIEQQKQIDQLRSK